eukprot:NODE_145_length_2943_cov_24.387074_g135_i0.p1 GENE.NODE_145_length_2943_cov_24.387074_g135_i0~~NODE_145_length_2943_cov_24.387074_g135_i0.p1  ORF type:complete len:685 (-),score=198.74 NODE_145_length_2943_cov_24.387074_g135_i0:333-2387(-)
MVQLLIHELGHADADLSDEYDYNMVESATLPLKNCHHTNAPTPWDHLRSDPSNPSWGVLNRGPVKGCSYSNYWRPTPEHCLMHLKDVKELCPVCAENALRAIYRDLTNLASPRCPRNHETVIITEGGQATLVMNRQFLAGPPQQFSSLTAWRHADGTDIRVDVGPIEIVWNSSVGVVRNKASIVVQGQALGLSNGVDHIITLTITDRSQLIPTLTDPQDLLHKHKYSTEYRVRVVPNDDPQYAICTGPLETPQLDPRTNECPRHVTEDFASFHYCAECQPDHKCDEEFTAHPIEAQANTEAAVELVEDMLLGVAGGLVFAGLLLFVVVWMYLAKRFSNRVQDIFPLSLALKLMRWAMCFTAVIMMLLSTTILIVALWAYSSQSAYGKAGILAGMLFAAVLYLVAFIGFTAAYFRNKVLMTVNGTVLSLVLVGLVVLTVIWFDIGSRIDTPQFMVDATEHWVELAAEHPKSVCSFQFNFNCSGFQQSCHNKFHSQCPSSCELTNMDNPNPCYNVFLYEQAQLNTPVGVVGVVISGSLLLCVIFNWVVCLSIRKRNQNISKRLHTAKPIEGGDAHHQYRAVNILRNLSNAERKSLKEEFRKVDRFKDGKIGPQELQQFIKNALGQSLPLEEVRLAVHVIDTNNDGQVSFREFLQLGHTTTARQARHDLLAHPHLKDVDSELLDDLF